MGGRAWTQDELDYVRDHMATHTVKEIADDLDRSVSSVYYKIRAFLEEVENKEH